MSVMDIEIVKAGWLQRQSSVLRRWKKNWFVLYRNGELAYFENQEKYEPEGKFIVCAVCIRIKTAGDCEFSPPEGCSKMCLLQLDLRQNEDMRLCAESPDDMRAWQIALEEARVMNMTGNNPPAPPGVILPPGAQVVYPSRLSHGYGGHVIATTATTGQYTVRDASGNQTVVMGNQPGQVIYVQEPYYYGRSNYTPFYGPVFWW